MRSVLAKHHRMPEERDERVGVSIEPAELVEGVLAAGPHPDEDDVEPEDAPLR